MLFRSLPVVRFLLNHGAHVNARTLDNVAPLHIASHVGRLNVVKELLNHGAPVHSRTRRGLTPLHIAVQGTNSNIVKELVRRGAKLSQRTEYMITLLAFARSNAIRSALGARAANRWIQAANKRRQTAMRQALSHVRTREGSVMRQGFPANILNRVARHMNRR